MTDPLTTVHEYIDAFNKGDADAMAAGWAEPCSILDGMAPHVWIGATAPTDWYRDVLIEGEHHGAAGYRLTLGNAHRNDVNGDSAYLVISATLTFELKGEPMATPGLFTVVLHNVNDKWLIRAWAWAKGIRL
jgi:ketosteroid isomerase-like protein